MQPYPELKEEANKLMWDFIELSYTHEIFQLVNNLKLVFLQQEIIRNNFHFPAMLLIDSSSQCSTDKPTIRKSYFDREVLGKQVALDRYRIRDMRIDTLK